MDYFAKILVNLKVLSKLQKNSKLCRGKNGLFEVDTYSYSQFIKRFFYNDNRYNMLHDIDELLLNTCREVIKSVGSNKHSHQSKVLAVALNESKKGIENLRVTYSNDIFVVSKLETFLDRINFMLLQLEEN